jgi:DNA-binding transcriptional MocR family regulator
VTARLSQLLSWTTQVATDVELPPTAGRLAVLIASHLASNVPGPFPSQAELASALGCHADSVARAIESLANRGHLTTRRDGRGKLNKLRYLPIIKAAVSPQPCGDNRARYPRIAAGIFKR